MAIVTGAARRIGAVIAGRMHARGLNVVVHCCRSREAAEELAGQLNAARPDSARVVVADLADDAAPQRLVQAALETWGRLDVLVNNASTFRPTPLGKITAGDWDDLVGSNLRAPLFLAQAAAPALRERGGAIVNMADIHGLVPLRDHAVYSPAKAGLVMLTRALAKDLAPAVRVNAVAPGAILWPENGSDEAAPKAEILEKIPLGRAGKPEDIAGAVAFLALDAPYVTGQVLAVDGGRLLNL